MDKHTTMTQCGAVWTGTIIHVDSVDRVAGGMIQSCGGYHLAIALAVDGGSWYPLLEGGGDWDAISADNLLDVVGLGRMDEDNETIADRLTAGMAILRGWAGHVRQLDPGNEMLGELADYLEERAAAAEAAAEDDDMCEDIASDCGMPTAD
jgi:hypothetical protein